MQDNDGQIAKDLNSKTILYEVDDKGNVTKHATVELSMVCDIKIVARLIKKIINTSEDSLIMNRKPESLRQQFYAACATVDIEGTRLHFPWHKYEPHFDLFLRHIEPMNFKPRIYWKENCEQDINACLKSIREEAKTAGFKKQVNAHDRSARKNYQKFIRYIDALFDCYSKLQVVRVDTKYRRPERSSVKIEDLISFSEMKKELKQFKKMVDQKYGDSLVGFAYKIEYGLLTSFHAHWLFFFNGQTTRADELIGSNIAEMWTAVVGKARGLPLNCNGDKARYPENRRVLGEVCHDDMEKRTVLNELAAYLIKPDYLLKLAAPGKGHTFETGNFPKPPSGLGRPRLAAELQLAPQPSVVAQPKRIIEPKWKRQVKRQRASGWVPGRNPFQPSFTFVNSKPVKPPKLPKPPKSVKPDKACTQREPGGPCN